MKYFINLPLKRRLSFLVEKRRESFTDTPLFPNWGKLGRIKKGNKLSRVFRHIFEHKNIKRLLGANLALVSIAGSFAFSSQDQYFTHADTTTVESSIVLTTDKNIQYPVNNVVISQDYKFYHPGIDFDGITGDSIYPIMDGVVEDVSYSNYAYGNAIYLNHEDNLTSLYAHLSKIEVIRGQEVAFRTKIGEIGATGYASGDHLHLEIRKNGYPINPLEVLP